MDYPPRVRAVLDRAKADQGDTVLVVAKGERYEGTLMPHHGFSGEDILTVKLPNGYNIGIAVADIESVDVTVKHSPASIERRLPPPTKAKPTVAVLGTGGTIAAYVDYRTGAVHPAVTAEELLFSVPELLAICDVRDREPRRSRGGHAWGDERHVWRDSPRYEGPQNAFLPEGCIPFLERDSAGSRPPGWHRRSLGARIASRPRPHESGRSPGHERRPGRLLSRSTTDGARGDPSGAARRRDRGDRAGSCFRGPDSGPPSRDPGRRGRRHDDANPPGARRHARLRYGPGPVEGGSHRGSRHDAGNGLREAHVGPRPHARASGGRAGDGDERGRRNQSEDRPRRVRRMNRGPPTLVNLIPRTGFGTSDEDRPGWRGRRRPH